MELSLHTAGSGGTVRALFWRDASSAPEFAGPIQRLVDSGNTVVVIGHNLDVIKCADWIIDLGPEGGDGGGSIVCTGTPEEVAACEGSFTGQYLKKML